MIKAHLDENRLDIVFTSLPTLEEVKTLYLELVTRHFEGSRTRAAQALGVRRETVYRMLADHGLDVPSTAPRTVPAWTRAGKRLPRDTRAAGRAVEAIRRARLQQGGK